LLQFELPADVSDLEVRAFVSEKSQVKVSSYEVVLEE
jgi:hypothetical protein